MYICSFVENPDLGNVKCRYCGIMTCSPRVRKCLNQESSPNRKLLSPIKIQKIIKSGNLPKEVVRNHLECIHISEGPFDDGLVEADPGCGCPNYGPKTYVFECAVHGECTPTGKAKDGSIMACKDCNHYLHKDSDDAKAT